MSSYLECFYDDQSRIISHNFKILSCPQNLSVTEFLKEIESAHFKELKIVQINFENDSLANFNHQKKLYSVAKATVFILKRFEFVKISLTDLETSRSTQNIRFKSLTTKDEFIEKVKLIKNEISKGRLYQANLTSALLSLTDLSAQEIYLGYGPLFKGQYKALLPLENCDVICFSPELFLHQTDGLLTTRPIKGSLSQNKSFHDQLLKNKKEESELSMIVDLLRNDLNSLSDENSAEVTKHRQPMELGYIQHTYSEVAVRNQHPLSFVLSKTLPGGSISGCPKIESLKVIAEIENHQRQIYTGTLGWWKENEFCLNIVIRSFVKSQDQLFYHAGCGIVFDSDPESEWDEFILKTGSLNVIG